MTRGVAAGLLAIVAIATVQAALAGSPIPRGPNFDERRYELWATNLYTRGFYGESATSRLAKEELRSVPYSAYVPPGYPFMLVTLKALHGDRPGVRRGVQAAFVGLTVLMAELMAFYLFGPIAALLTGAILVATGVLATYAQLTMSEILATVTFIGALGLLMLGLRRRSWRLLLAAGAVFGYSILTRPQILLLPVPLAVYIFFAAGRRKRAVLLAVVFVVASYGVVAPWTIRNELRLHAFAPVASYTWYNFWEVNNPRANGLFISPERKIPETIRQIRTLPEVQQDLALRNLALKWVRAHPLKAAKGWVRDTYLYLVHPDPWVGTWYTLHGWRPPRLDERFPIALALVSFLMALFFRRRWPSIGIFIIVVAYFLVFFSFFLPVARYRVSLLPVFAILAAGLPEMLADVIRERRSRIAPSGDASVDKTPSLA